MPCYADSLTVHYILGVAATPAQIPTTTILNIDTETFTNAFSSQANDYFNERRKIDAEDRAKEKELYNLQIRKTKLEIEEAELRIDESKQRQEESKLRQEELNLRTKEAKIKLKLRELELKKFQQQN